MKSLKVTLFAALGLVVWLAGCEVKDPGKTGGNTAPTTRITVAPQEGATVNHYLQLGWFGNDVDGEVVGYNLYVDSVLIGFTAAAETTLAFAAPVTGVVTAHTFMVEAVDDNGLRDPNPPHRSFNTVNWAPHATLITDGAVAPGDTVGLAFRVIVSATDTNLSFLRYSMSLDNETNWSAPSRDSVFIFADPALIADTALFPDNVNAVSNEGLAPGWHRLYLRVVDAGGAYSSTILDSFYVVPGFRPAILPGVTGQYGTSSFYPDGSVYYTTQAGMVTHIGYEADASLYHGEINAYRYRMAAAVDPQTELGEFGPWSDWAPEGTVDTTDLQPGTYLFQLMARDLAGAFSDTVDYTVRLVRQQLSDSVIVVAETRNGTGVLGSPLATVVDTFYAHILAGSKFRIVRYTDVETSPTDQFRPGEYASPYDVRHAGLVVWHSDDKTDIRVHPDSVSVQLMRDYLGQGGRLILSGWDVLKYIAGNADSVNFASGSFARERLRLFGATRNSTNPRNARGYSATNGFPEVLIDSLKLPVAFHGRLDACWTFDLRGEDERVGLMVTTDPASRFNGRPSSYIYDLSFRVAVFGVPLYFCEEDQVRALFWNPDDPAHGVIQRMLQGLSSSL